MLKIGSAFNSSLPIFLFQLETPKGTEVGGAKSRSIAQLLTMVRAE